MKRHPKTRFSSLRNEKIMYHFIVNPASSSGNGLKTWNKARAALAKEGIAYRVHMLRGPGDAAEIAAKLSEGTKERTIVVVGGDGTINDFVSGLQRFDGIRFGCLPTGSGNDFIRGMGLKKDTDSALEHLIHPRGETEINVGRAVSGEKSRCFAVSSGFGYDAAVCYQADRSFLKKPLNALHLGKLIYLVQALIMMIRIKPFSLRLVLDEKQLLSFDRVIFAAAMNTPYEGGGFKFTPDADPADDKLDLFVAEGIPKWKVLLLLPLALFGLHTRYKGIHIYRCSSALLRAHSQGKEGADSQCIHTDGEHFGFSDEIRYTLCPGRLKLIN